MSTITTDINLALSSLREEKVVAIPTETVYGLAGNALSETAIKQIFKLKNRPLNHPLIMHITKDWDLLSWVSSIPDYANVLIKHFWPGPLTLVFQAKSKGINSLITGGQSTIALRCPGHPLALSLLNELNFPLVAPSANPFGKLSPTTAEHVRESFKEEPILILDGGRCNVGIESTIVMATDPKGYQILRHGLITELDIRDVLPNKELKANSSVRVPGRLEYHYQPEKPLYCFSSINSIYQFCSQINEKAYVISFTKTTDFSNEYYYQLPMSPQEAAFELYYQIRQADHSTAACIIIETPPRDSAWEGVYERIIKASLNKGKE